MGSFTALDWYETPLYYDIVFSEDDEREGRFLEDLLREHGPAAARGRRRKVLEPACGSGRLLLGMARRGFDVAGFDANESMLRFARTRLERAGKRAKLAVARLEDFDVGRGFDLAHCMVNTFKYLLDERTARGHLECIARALRRGGLYAIGMHLTDYDDQLANHERWVSRRGRVEVVCNIRGWPPQRRARLERVRSRLCVVEQGEVKRTETEWQFRTYDLAQFRRLVRSVPELELVAIYDFDYDLARPRARDSDRLDAVFVLRRR